MNMEGYSKINISESDAREIESIYDDLLGIVKKLSGKAGAEAVYKIIADSIDLIIKTLSSKGESLLLYTSKIFDKDYIFAHSLNVCLISIRIGLRLKFDKKRLENLGSLALTHAGGDIGLPEKLLMKIGHDKELDEIVKLADVYDALTHPPAYRHATPPAKTITSIVETDKFFDRALVKILIEELSFYPKGSWIQLCTDEIGRVIGVNRDHLLRPTVEIFMDGKGKQLKEARTIDLSKNIASYILRPLTEEEIKHLIKQKQTKPK